MFYAVRLCGNPNHKRYLKPIEFIMEECDEYGENGIPLERESMLEILEVLEDIDLYQVGWVEIIEIGE